MTDTHEGIRREAGLYEGRGGLMCVCLNELLRAYKVTGSPARALDVCRELVEKLTSQGYKYVGTNGEGHFFFSLAKKGGKP